MEDIRLIESTAEFLVLETSAGEKYRLIVDDELRSATRKVISVKSVSESMSPREIQEQIRAGASVAHLANQTGLALELIEKFAAPVIDEIAFIVSSALSIRLSIAGAKPNTTEHVEFGEIIAGRLRASGAAQPQWSAVKLESNAWRVMANFTLADESHSAAWVFEPKKLTLAPENDMAIRLSTEEILAAQPAGGLRVIASSETRAEVPVAAVVAAIENETLEEELEHQVEIESNSTTDLLDAMRRKRESRKSEPAADVTPMPEAEVSALEALNSGNESEAGSDKGEPEIVAPRTAALEAAPVASRDETKSEDTQGEATAKKPTSSEARKARASMPSWDQIVFGSKADD